MQKIKLISKPINKFRIGGAIPKFRDAGILPIGNQAQYDHVAELYQALVDKGVDPQAALEIVSQKVAEKGWSGYVTGDNKKYSDANSWADHILDWHGRMYPDSLKAQNFDEYYNNIMVTPKYKYNRRGLEYRRELERTRPGVKKRINYYRKQKGLEPLAYNSMDEDDQILYSQKGGLFPKLFNK